MLHNRFRRPAFAAALLAATAMAGVTGWEIAPAYSQTTAPEPAAPIDTSHPAAQALPGFADLVQRVSPAVVTITSTIHEAADEDASPFAGSPQGREFGRMFGMPNQGAPQVVHALGSGFIVDAQGHVVTNNHVVNNATDIQVTLADGRKMAAKVVGTDPKTDLAVLQVRSDGTLPHLALGNSDAARVGDWVVAVGNPFGLGGTVTAGILSARGRQIGEGPYDDFLQVDAPINRGNSGGPLFAQDGSVIGGQHRDLLTLRRQRRHWFCDPVQPGQAGRGAAREQWPGRAWLAGRERAASVAGDGLGAAPRVGQRRIGRRSGEGQSRRVGRVEAGVT